MQVAVSQFHVEPALVGWEVGTFHHGQNPPYGVGDGSGPPKIPQEPATVWARLGLNHCSPS